MLPDTELELVLFSNDRVLTQAWQAAFLPWPEVKVWHTDLKDLPKVDAVVAAGNCYAVMDGTLDLAMAQHWVGMERSVAKVVEAKGGYIPVGAAVVAPPRDPEHPYCVYAPTMRIPMPLRGRQQLNVFNATWAALWAAYEYPQREGLWTLAVPGLGAGIGQVDPRIVAALMQEAWKQYRVRKAATVGVATAMRRDESLLQALEG